ncbi:MAG: phosphoenolpyruvate carboxykinase [Gammaproteobacteria bacterium]
MLDVCAESLVKQNLSIAELVQHALQRGEGELSDTKAFVARTGARTGRSPNDRFVVRDDITENTVDWGNINRPFDMAKFDALWHKVADYLAEKGMFIADLCVGADSQHFVPVKVMNELAWHNIFAQHMFVRDASHQNASNSWQIMSAPNFHAQPAQDGTNSEAAVILNFKQRKVLICGTHYAGEMKKAMFSVLNYLLPAHDVLPMHCSANVGQDSDVAIFFGLSGTGKTTLSADPNRFLIGDDEHGWNDDGIFNFEGGCYAKCINLSQENEPVIWNAIRDHAIMENVVIDNITKVPDFTDGSLTQNTRCAYPREYIDMRVTQNRAGQPSAILFLTCDLYGVLPPVARLTKQQAAYYFLSGYTALVGSTEVGQTEAIKPTFSTCFGAPFFPRPAQVYADLLMKRIEKSGCEVYLVNTGWTGGAYGQGGKRFAIPTTRSIVNAILNGDIKQSEFEIMPKFNFAIPTQLKGVETQLLNPRNVWQDQQAFDSNVDTLIRQFVANFKRFDVAEAICAAGPQV